MASDKPDNGPDQGSQQSSELEEQFLKGYRPESSDDEFDEELLSLTKTRNRGSVLRPILMILVIFVVGWVIYDWRDELNYFFSSGEAVEVGDVSQFPVKAANDPDWTPPIAHNQYVSIEGMPTRISGGGEYEFFRLVGGEIYVQREVDDDKSRSDGDTRSLPSRSMGPDLSVDEHRQRYEGKGRLISFRANPARVAGIKAYFGQRYKTRFCEDYTHRQIEDMERQRLEVYRENWRQRFEQATDEERAENQLSAAPTPQQEQDLLERNPVCVEAYLVHDGQRPFDHWWYVVFSAFLSIFVAFNIFKLYRWFKEWLRP